MESKWEVVYKNGVAYYSHPNVYRVIIRCDKGIFYRGISFDSVIDAQDYALHSNLTGEDEYE